MKRTFYVLFCFFVVSLNSFAADTGKKLGLAGFYLGDHIFYDAKMREIGRGKQNVIVDPKYKSSGIKEKVHLVVDNNVVVQIELTLGEISDFNEIVSQFVASYKLSKKEYKLEKLVDSTMTECGQSFEYIHRGKEYISMRVTRTSEDDNIPSNRLSRRGGMQSLRRRSGVRILIRYLDESETTERRVKPKLFQ